MPETMTINQQPQLGLEVTPGVSPGGGSNKLLTGLNLQIDPDFGTNQYAGMGRRFDSISVPSMERSKLKFDGALTYTESVYTHSGVLGPAAITTPAGAINGRLWTFAPGLTGPIAGSTYQIQQGSATRARQVNYGTFTDVGFVATRKDCKTSGAGFAQAVQDGITLTATPTAIPLIPVQPREWNIYLDTSSAGLGTTKLLRCFNATFGYTGAYNDIWPLDRAQSSFASTVNAKPSLAVSLELMADTVWTNLWTQARAATKLYLRYEAISSLLVDNYQTLSISGTPTGGTFTLTYKGVTTAGIAFNAAASAVQSALTALSTIGTGNVTCSGGALPGSPVVITFTGALANDTSLLTHTDSFTGGTSPAASLTATTVPYSYVLDCCVIPVPGTYQDDNNAWTETLDLKTVEDPTWLAGGASGTAIIAKITNGLAAL